MRILRHIAYWWGPYLCAAYAVIIYGWLALREFC